jgi:hypothetical protein
MMSAVDRRSTLRGATLALAFAWAATLGAVVPASAQAPPAGEETRAATIVAQQYEKAKHLKPYEPNKAEQWVKKLEEQFITGSLHWHPFFQNAYAGGGFTLGAGYLRHVGSYNTIDFRGSYTLSGYTRLETEFLAPRLFDRRAQLSLIGGWRKATQVGFYGFGTGETSADDRANYSFTRPYGTAVLTLRPTRGILVLEALADYSKWDQGSGEGNKPSVEEIYTPDELPGLNQAVTYLQLAGTAAIDWRTSPGYSRRGGYYGVTFNNYMDPDDQYSFKRVDYEAIQHIPILRDAWVLSLRGRVETTSTGDGEEVPFFMLPALGGGSSLRGFASWRFRDRNSLLLQAEWRVLVNSFFETAIFYDAGKVEARAQDLDLDGLKSDFGIGFRLHGPAATPVRIELAKGNEGLALVFAASASF